MRVLATLPELFLPPSNRLVVPVVGWWDDPRDVTVGDPHEVARVARVPLADLTDPANRYRLRHPAGFIGPAFCVADMEVWGFTAGLLDAILEAAGLAPPWDTADVRPLPESAIRPYTLPGLRGRRRGRRRRADGRRSRARRPSDAYRSPAMSTKDRLVGRRGSLARWSCSPVAGAGTPRSPPSRTLDRRRASAR